MRFNRGEINIKKSVIILMMLIMTLLMSNVIWAATHNVSLSAEVLPNGQMGYQMISHTSSDGGVPSYPDEAVIPGPHAVCNKRGYGQCEFDQ